MHLPFVYIIYFIVRQPLVGQGVLTVAASRSHDTPHSIGLVCTCDQAYAETSAWQNTTLTKRPCPSGIRIRKLNKRAAANPRLDRAATGICEVSSIRLRKEEVTKGDKRWFQVTFQSRDFSCSAVSKWIHAWKFLLDQWIKPVVSLSNYVQFKTENDQD